MNRDFFWFEKALGDRLVAKVDCLNCKADGMRTTIRVEATDSDTVAWFCETCGDSDIKTRPVPPPKQDGDPGAQPPPSGPANRGQRRLIRPFKGFVSSADFMATRRPPDYLIDGLVERGKTYFLTGHTGSAKTLLAIYAAIKIAQGGGFFGRDCRQGKVAFFAGENPENTKSQFYSMCAELGVDYNSLPIIWHEGVTSLTEDVRKVIAAVLQQHPDLALLVYDSLQAFFEGEDDNANMPMLDLVTNIRALPVGHPNAPANMILAHPNKSATKDNLVPRGGSAALNEGDGNLTASTENNVGELHWCRKFRGVPFDPIKFETVVIKPEGLVNARGEQMPCTIIRGVGPTRAAEMQREIERRWIAILEAIEADPTVSQNSLAPTLMISRKTIQDTFKTLREKMKWIKQYGQTHTLTNEGKKALKLMKEAVASR